MKIAIVLLSFFAIVKSQYRYACPSSEDIKPCYCVLGSDKRAQISCDYLKSANKFVKAVSNLKGFSISQFKLQSSDIGVLPSDAFSDMEIFNLEIIRCNLTRLGDTQNRPPFLGLENCLQSLQIKNSFVDTNIPLSSFSVSHLKKLSYILSEGNIIPTIGNNWFENGPYSLKHLSLYNTNTSVIGSHAFHALDNLVDLSLTGGSISEITREMFPMPTFSIQSLDLRDNKIKTLPENIFSGMPFIYEVMLHNNLLTAIDEIIWAPVWVQLDYVSFHENPIICNSNLKWIYKYRLPEHYGGYCSSPAKLQNRDLREIQITDLQ